MLEKVFVVGRSGSGKTTAAKIIAESIPSIAQSIFHEKLSSQRFRDYDILYNMYQEDMAKHYPNHKYHRFRKAEYNGFEVLDYSAFDEALLKLQEEVTTSVASNYPGFVTVEFARNNYQHALKIFSDRFLEHAHLLFVDCDVEECIRRIYKRISNPPRPDFHFVPERIMRSYFSEDNVDYMAYFGEDTWGDQGQHYTTDFPFLERVKAIDNTHLSLEAFQKEVENFASLVVKSHFKNLLIAS